MLKKIISIFLIIVLFAPFWLTFSIYHLEKKTIKKSVKKLLISQLDENQLVTLKFSKDELYIKLRWEHSKEFEFNEVMYDIVKSEEKADSVTYLCWQDDEETALNRNFLDMLQSALQKDKKANKLFSQLVSAQFNYLLFEFPFLGKNNLYKTIFYFSQINNFYKSINISPSPPPPNYKAFV
jgi:hypothetical protein